MADASSLEIRRDNKILMLTLNRPEVRNAFTAEMNTQMAEAILAADFDDDIAMIAITGAGDKAFCSGAKPPMPARYSGAPCAPQGAACSRS